MAVSWTPLFGIDSASERSEASPVSAADTHFAAAGTSPSAAAPATIPVVADGTDQSAVINAWLANPNHTVLKLPAGEFWLSSNIIIPDGKTLIGAGEGATILSLLPDYEPQPRDSRTIIVNDGSTLSSLTLDGQKVNLDVFPADRVCGVVGVGQDFLVENVTVKDVTGYAFWANGGSTQNLASGTFRNCYAENANMLFETTHANGVVFDNCVGADGDDDIPMDAAFHPTADSNNITFVDCAYEGNAHVVNVLANLGPQQNIRFIRVEGVSTDGATAVWAGGAHANQIFFEDSNFVSTRSTAMSISGGANVTATGSSFTGHSIGISIASGEATLIDTDVTARTEIGLGISTFAVYGGPVTVEGGRLTAVGGGLGTAAFGGTATVSNTTVVVAAYEAHATDEDSPLLIDLLGRHYATWAAPLAITHLNGVSVGAGTAIALASGATLTMGTNGYVTYDPKSAHGALAQAGTGAANQWALESFTYTLSNGVTLPAVIDVGGVASSGDRLLGKSTRNDLTGTAGADYFLLDQGGVDSASGHGGNDVFDFGGTFTVADRVDGGAGSDALLLRGAYSLGLRFEETGLSAVETIQLQSRGGGGYFSYNLSMHDGNVAAGQRLLIDAAQLRYGENVMFYGQAELDGGFDVRSGSGHDWLFGGQGNDSFAGGLGTDRISGNGGADRFAYRSIAELSPDRIDGGLGTDTLQLDGNFGVGFVFAATTMTGVERIALGSSGGVGYNIYKLTFNNANVAAGGTLSIDGSALGRGENMFLYGSAESDGRFVFTGGGGNDWLQGGAGADWFQGGAGRDNLRGNGGADTFAYGSAAESSGIMFDQLAGFDWRADRIDLPTAVSGWNGSASGVLNSSTFDANLAAAVNGALEARGAMLFQATSGNYAGRSFLIVDGNGDGAYTGGADYVLELVSPAAPLPGTTDFFI